MIYCVKKILIFTIQNTDQTQGGLIYAKNQLHITAANQLLNDKSSIVAQGSILINDTNNNSNTNSNNSHYEKLG
jgi:adhesin HecA-like repeat protein